MGLGSLSAETLIFIFIILVLAITFHVRYDEKIAEQAPTILTTLGIFATFFAIALGLLRFDSVNIQDSVPQLLDSMKTAFWASVAGVGTALSFNFRRLYSNSKYINEPSIEEKLLEEIKGLRSNSREDLKDLTRYIEDSNNNKEMLVELKNIRNDNSEFFKDLVKQIDESDAQQELLTELKGLRADSHEDFKNLIEAQNEALDRISKTSSEELVRALEVVVKDFNAKINEQFGENFKQLNQAVGDLLTWQEEYKTHIEVTTKILTTTIQNTQNLVSKVESIVKDSDVITENSKILLNNIETFKRVADNLENTIGSLDVQRKAIDARLESLAKLVSKASDDLPEINQKILGIAKTMQNSALDFNRNVAEMSNKTQEQVNALNNGLEYALSQSLNSLGGQLSAMTEKFAADYDELSKALARISKVTQKGGQ